jgi:hypothetical protein
MGVTSEMKGVAYAAYDVAVSGVVAPFSLWSETLCSFLTAPLAAATSALAEVAEETADVKAKK